jgi:hypothetical protein
VHPYSSLSLPLTNGLVKYTEKGNIVVRCKSLDDPDKTKPGEVATEILVEDTGCGIPSEKLDHIFREFEQVEKLDSNLRKNEKAEEMGVGKNPITTLIYGFLRKQIGVGLAVVARIVSQLGGQLRVESKVGEGTTVSFLIPLSLPETKPPGTRTSSSSSIRLRKRISASSESEEIGNLVDALAKGAGASGRGSPVLSKTTTPNEKSPLSIELNSPLPSLTPSIPQSAAPEQSSSKATTVASPKVTIHEPLRKPLAHPLHRPSSKAGSARTRVTSGIKLRILIVEVR